MRLSLPTLKNGKEQSQLFRWDEVEDEPKSDNARRKADAAPYHFKPSLFAHYKSAELHTMQKRINWRTKKAIGIFAVVGVLIAGLGWWLYTGVFAAFTQGDEAAQVAGDSAATPTKPAPAGLVSVDPAEDPLLRFAPRIAGMPWTAPAYDDFEVRDYPRAFCIISGDQSKERISCNCYTQQATPLDMDDRTCISLARNGYFDPRLPPIEERERNRQESPFAESSQQAPALASAVPAPVGIGSSVDRSIRQPYTPPDFLSR